MESATLGASVSRVCHPISMLRAHEERARVHPAEAERVTERAAHLPLNGLIRHVRVPLRCGRRREQIERGRHPTLGDGGG